jgi:WD40 repeat protein
MKNWRSVNEDEVINCIDTDGSGRTAIGTFRPYSSCALYIVSASGETLHRLHHNFPVADVKFSAVDSRTVITVSDYVRVWNVDSGQLTMVLSPLKDDSPDLCPFTAIAVSPDSNTFAVVDIRGLCSVYDGQKKDPVEMFEMSTEKLEGISFVNDNVIGCVGESGSVYVLDRTSHHVVCTQGIEAQPRCQPVKLAWLPNLSLVAVAYQISGSVSVYELTSPIGTPRLLGSTKPGESIADICWLSQQYPEYLVVARDSGNVEVWNKSNLTSPHFDFRSATGVSAVKGTSQGVLVGSVDGEVFLSELPERLKASEIAPFNHFSQPTSSYPALA